MKLINLFLKYLTYRPLHTIWDTSKQKTTELKKVNSVMIICRSFARMPRSYNNKKYSEKELIML